MGNVCSRMRKSVKFLCESDQKRAKQNSQSHVHANVHRIFVESNPPMNVRGSGAAPLNDAPEKSKPGCYITNENI